MNQKKRGFFLLAWSLAFLALGLVLAFLVSKGWGLFCPMEKLTGLRCPGCGNTRATIALLRLDFKAMLQFNLLYPVEMIYLARIYVSCAKNYIKNGRFRYHTRPDRFDLVCLASILIWTVVRNVISL